MEKLNAYLQGRKASDLAKETGLSVATISLLRKGLRTPSFATMRAIHDATNGQVTFNDWYEGAK